MDDKENIKFPHYWNYCVEKPSITVSSHESHGKNHRQLKCLFESMFSEQQRKHFLTHWGRVTNICVSKTTIIGSDNGLSPGRRQAIIWTNAGILLIGTLGTNFSEILIECHSFSFKKMHMKMSSGKWRPSCLGLNVLKLHYNTPMSHFGPCVTFRPCQCHFLDLPMWLFGPEAVPCQWHPPPRLKNI